MAKVGLKDTLTLLAKGYSKKEIDALAELDEQSADQAPATEDKKEQDQKPEAVPETTPVSDPEPDYKALYEEQLKKAKEAEEKLKKVQKDNINSNSAPDVDAAKEKQSEDLLKLVSSFM